MPTFEITSPNGQKYRVTGPDGATEQDALQQIQSQFAQPPSREPAPNAGESQFGDAPVTAGGLYNAADIGAQRFVSGVAGLPRAIGDLGSRGIQAAQNLVADKMLGRPDLKDTRDLSKPGLVTLPTSEEALATIQDPKGMFGGKSYEPQNLPERLMARMAEYAPNAMFPSGAAMRAANVVAPAVASQAVEEMGGGPVSQAAAAIAGGMGAAKVGNIAERMAAGALPSLERGVANSLPDAAQAQYTNITNLATQVRTTAPQRTMIADSIERHLHSQNFRRANAPETLAVLDDIRNPGGAAPDVADLLTARRRLGNIRGEDGVAAGQARDIVDQAIEAYIPGVGRQLATADQNWNAYRTAQMLGQRFNRAELQAAGANSGLNLGNRLRQQAQQVVTNPRLTRYMNPEDVAALEAVVRGTASQNVIRWAGNYLGGGGGLGALGASALLGHLGGGPLGAAAAVGGGLALKRGYNRSIARGAQGVADRILARSPEAQAQGARYVAPLTIARSVGASLPRSVPGFLPLEFSPQPPSR